MTDDSFGPAVCRVCLSGETSIPYMGSKGGEPLISACHCKWLMFMFNLASFFRGTMGLYHKSCLEHWLYMSHTTYCEICNFRFQYGTYVFIINTIILNYRKNQSICAYIRLKGWRERGYRNLPSDFFSTLCVSPMPLITIYYFIQAGIKSHQVMKSAGDRSFKTAKFLLRSLNSIFRWNMQIAFFLDNQTSYFSYLETVPLFIIALVIFATISFLYIITIWFHVMQFFSWQEHHKVKCFLPVYHFSLFTLSTNQKISDPWIVIAFFKN